MTNRPYLVRAIHTDNPNVIQVTLSRSDSDAPHNGLVDFFNIHLPQSCFTSDSEPRFSPRGLEILTLIDPDLMESTAVYRPGTVRMSIHRSNNVPELAEYHEWLKGYLRGYRIS
jgi:hypothetical protein